MGEFSNRFVGVVHAEHNSSVFEVEDFVNNCLTAIIRKKRHQELSSLLCAEFSSSVLVSKSVSANDNWFSPAGNKPWNVLDNDWLAEDSSTQDVSNSTVWRLLHLFELELLNTRLIGGNGSALDTNSTLLDSRGSIDSDLVISSISVLNAEIKILNFEVEVRDNQLK
jgi:hypothetical protein